MQNRCHGFCIVENFFLVKLMNHYLLILNFKIVCNSQQIPWVLALFHKMLGSLFKTLLTIYQDLTKIFNITLVGKIWYFEF